jgi:hypothetical protein
MSSSGEAGRCYAEPAYLRIRPGRTRVRNNGVEPYALYDDYEDSVLRAAGGLARARIDLELLHKAVPESWVPIAAALIADGPDTAAARAHAAIYDYSKESVKANRRRTAGARSRSTVLIVLSEARRLFSVIHSLHTLPACREWAQTPRLHMPDMSKGGYMKSSLHALKRHVKLGKTSRLRYTNGSVFALPDCRRGAALDLLSRKQGAR